MSARATAPLARGEMAALLVVGVLGLVWLVLPEIAQPQSYHGFADQRPLGSIPNAADVLSNIAFAIAGLYGMGQLARGGRTLAPVMRACLAALFTGLVVTAFGSGYYHWAPSDARLVWDRLPMTLAMAGAFGAIYAERVSARSGLAILVLLLVVGPFSVAWWARTGDLALYGIVQFGGIAAVLFVLGTTPKPANGLPWWSLVAWYIAAKVFEALDVQIWNATGGILAGHALKHVAAAMGGWVVARALRSSPR